MTSGPAQRPSAFPSPAQPDRECNLIMEGGVTSGIIYPPAIVELARAYRLRKLGGTSAGAIAAACAAAAELGRLRGRPQSFSDLEALAHSLASRPAGRKDGPTQLQLLFQPQDTTRGLFDAAFALQRARGRLPAALLGVARTVLPRHAGAAALGALPGLITLKATSRHRALAAVSVGVSAAGALLGAGVSALRAAPRQLESNGFGLCNGLTGTQDTGMPGLTVWLTEQLDALSGKDTDPAGIPLTVGDLWRGANTTWVPGQEKAVEFEALTTSLAHGRPYRMPWSNRTFYFRPEEFRRYFPERVVVQMEAAAAAEWARQAQATSAADQERRERYRAAGFLPFPRPQDLPVVVMVRMSLSFPVLLSAVPLHAVDYTQLAPPRRARRDELLPEPCWFSDGGLTSNFPIHLFDAPLSKRVTFAINLRGFPRGVTAEMPGAVPVFFPTRNGSGVNPVYDPVTTTGEFLMGVLDSAKNWNDTMTVTVPGYRERIVHVSLSAQEGGLNLNMDAEVLRGLMDRGRDAGRLLREEFAPAGQSSPTAQERNHQWIRYRSLLACLEVLAKDVTAVHEPSAFDALDRSPPSYAMTRGQKALADLILTRLAEISAFAEQQQVSLTDGAPRPSLELRLRPEL